MFLETIITVIKPIIIQENRITEITLQQVIIVTEQEVRIRKQKELHFFQEKHKIQVIGIAYQIKAQEVRLDIQKVHQQDHALADLENN